MPLNYRTEEYYKKFIELQEKLRKSEEERLKLEMKFNEMVKVTKEETQIHYRKLKAQYKRFLEEDRRRQDRNERILRTLERIETRVAMLTAKTERFKLLREQYHNFLDRTYQLNQTKKLEVPRIGRQPVCSEPKPYDNKGKSKPSVEETVENYVQNLSSREVRNFPEKERESRERLPFSFISDGLLENRNNYDDLYVLGEGSFKPNYANFIADDIMDSIYSRNIKYNSRDKSKPVTITKELNNNNNLSAETKNLKHAFPTSDMGAENLFKFDGNLEKNDKEQAIISDKIEDSDMDDDISEDEKVKQVPIEFENHQDTEYKRDNPEDFSEQNANRNPSLIQVNNKNETVNTVELSYENPDNHQLNEDKVIHEDITAKPSIYKNKEENQTFDNLLDVMSTEQLNVKREEVTVQQGNEKPLNENKSHEGTDDSQEQQNENELLKLQQLEVKSLTSDSQQPSLNFNDNSQTAYDYDDGNQQLKQSDDDKQLAPQHDETEQSVFQEQYYDENIPLETYDESGHYVQQYDENGQPILYDQYGQLLQQYDENGHLLPQYDESGQLFQQYDESGQFIQQYDESGQPLQQYNESNQLTELYSENGQPILEYDKSGQLLNEFNVDGKPVEQYDETVQPQYDEEGHPIQQYDEISAQSIHQYDGGQPVHEYAQDEQPFPPYDDNGQFIQYDNTGQIHYDEDGELIQQYDKDNQPVQREGSNEHFKQDDEGGPLIQQVEQYDDGSGTIPCEENEQRLQQHHDDNQQIYYDQQYNENAEMSRRTENIENDRISEQPGENVRAAEEKKSSNVMEMLDTDTESAKQETKVSNDSDFDFSNG